MSLAMRYRTLLLLAAVGCAGPAATTTGTASPALSGLSASSLRRDMDVVASDSFGGRATGTIYAQKAAEWLARQAAAIGLQPAGDSGYFSRVPLRRSMVIPGAIEVSAPGQPVKALTSRDVGFLTILGPGAPLPKNSVDAEVAFVQYGLVDTAIGRNDYANAQLQGKVVVIAGIAPPGVSPEKRKELENPEALFNRLGMVIMRQPAAVVLLLPDSVFALAASQFGTTQLRQDDGKATATGARMLPMVVFGKMSSPLLPAGWPSVASALPAGTRFKASYAEKDDAFNAYNVVAIAPGSDAALSKTYVGFGAHYDHVGIGTPQEGDSIYNGADDDGSGTVTLLGIARDWMQGPRPARSALFVWHVGEENGLFGSARWTDHPTVPIDSVVAMLNADMIGRNASDSLYIVGPGAAPNGQSSVLGAVLDSVNTSGARPFAFNREWDTTTHPERIYYRSDHFNYARKGIPIVFFTTGLHAQYHKSSDEAQLIDYAKMGRVGELMLRTGRVLGNRPTRPKPTATQ